MTAMPIRSTLVPSALKGQENGAVAEALLEMVDRPGYVWKLASLPARGMRAMHAAIKADLGIVLSSTGRGRSFQTQYTVFLQRYTPVSRQIYDTLAQGKRRIWADAVTKYGLTSIYWSLKPGNAMAAVPGTSPHGMWCADDLCLPGNKPLTPAVLEWLYSHELNYGFAHSTLSENWHCQWWVGDAVPAAVAAYEKQHDPPPEKPPTEDDMALVIYRATDPPAVLAGLSSPPQYPAFQLELLKDDETINDFRAAGAIDYPHGPLPATAFKRCTIIGLVPPGWIEGTHYRQVVA